MHVSLELLPHHINQKLCIMLLHIKDEKLIVRQVQDIFVLSIQISGRIFITIQLHQGKYSFHRNLLPHLKKKIRDYQSRYSISQVVHVFDKESIK